MTAVIFDFDGTIADSFGITVRAYNRVAPWFGYARMSASEVEAARATSLEHFVRTNHIHGWRALFLVFVMKLMTADQIRRVALFSGAPEMVRGLRERGVVVGILTSNLYATAAANLRRNGLFSDFAFVASRVNVFGKDAALTWLAKKYGLDVAQTYYVGDETRDMEAAKRAGMKSIGVSWGFQTREALERVKPDFIVDTPAQILNIVHGKRM